MNRTRFPKEDHLPEWARRDNKDKKGDRVYQDEHIGRTKSLSWTSDVTSSPVSSTFGSRNSEINKSVLDINLRPSSPGQTSGLSVSPSQTAKQLREMEWTQQCTALLVDCTETIRTDLLSSQTAECNRMKDAPLPTASVILSALGVVPKTWSGSSQLLNPEGPAQISRWQPCLEKAACPQMS